MNKGIQLIKNKEDNAVGILKEIRVSYSYLPGVTIEHPVHSVKEFNDTFVDVKVQEAHE